MNKLSDLKYWMKNAVVVVVTAILLVPAFGVLAALLMIAYGVLTK